MLTIKKLSEITEHFNIEGDDYGVFIETGTYLGETVEALQPYFLSIHTIEISEFYFNRFESEHANYENVTRHLGDSSNEVPKILEKLTKNDKCIFWLDGHFSSGQTSKGEKDCPLIEECAAINELYKSNESLVLIDDYSLFGTDHMHDWKDITYDNVLKCFSNFNVDVHERVGETLCLHIKRK